MSETRRAPVLASGPGSARRLASWIVSPAAYANAALAIRTRFRVLRGPFAGTRYPPRFAAGAFAGPCQVGSYERELDPWIERLIAERPASIVNVGAGSGYYATGLALRCPSSRVIAFELDRRARADSRRIGELNGVGDRIELHGAATKAELAALGPALDGDRPWALIDCEGCEAELVDPGTVAWLREAAMIVELHPRVEPAIEERLRERLAATHELELVAGEARWSSQVPELWGVRGLRAIDRELLVAEYRHGPQDWLVAVPRRAEPG